MKRSPIHPPAKSVTSSLLLRTALGLIGVLAMCAAPAAAQGLIFVDGNDDAVGSADPDGFTFGPNANLAAEASFNQTGNGVDNLWGRRIDIGSEGPSARFVWESSGIPGPEDSPEITQTLTGLTANTSYNVYAVWWSSNANWTIRAGTTSGALQLYDRFGTREGAIAGTRAYTANWATPPTSLGNPIYTEADRTMFLGLAGTVTANAQGRATIFIDDLPGGDGDRTWFDGLAYMTAPNVVPAFGDFNGAGGINLTDFTTLMNNLHRPLGTITVSDAYRSGDMNADLAVNVADFIAFRTVYDAVHGVGALAAATGVVPEPSTAFLAGGMIAVAATRVRRRVARALTLATLVAGVALTDGAAYAQITYLDATPDNTVQASGGPIVAGTDRTGVDNIWALRTLGNGGTAYESGGELSPAGNALNGNNENAPRWATTVTGLIPNKTYEGFAYFWSPAGNQSWGLQAGFTNPAGDLPAFARVNSATATAAPAAAAVNFDVAPLVVEADRTMYQASLGFGKSNGSGALTFYIDDHPAPRQDVTDGWNFRTWYDGVGTAPASTLTLRVNAASGGMSIMNTEATAFNVIYFEVRSPGNVLNTNGWQSIDGNIPASETSFEKAGGAHAGLISEGTVLGMHSFAAAPSPALSLGNALNVGATDNLEFWFLQPGDTALRRGLVEVVNAPSGDFDGDGNVDGNDFITWQRTVGFGQTAATLVNWRNTFGQGFASAAFGVVPEPATACLAGVACFALARVSRRRQG